MKWLLCLPLPLALALAACSGGTPSGSTVPASTPSPTASAIVSGPDCDDPLPDGTVAFQGTVLRTDPRNGIQLPTVTIKIERVQNNDSSVAYWAYTRNSVLTVSLKGRGWPEFHVGSCVIGTGRELFYSCGSMCDAVCFEAETLAEVESEVVSKRCDDPLPPGTVAFQGQVVGGESTLFTELRYITKVDVRIERSEIAESAIDYDIDDYAPGSTLTVVIYDEPAPESGLCVVGAGRNTVFACGFDCEAIGFVADRFYVIDQN